MRSYRASSVVRGEAALASLDAPAEPLGARITGVPCPVVSGLRDPTAKILVRQVELDLLDQFFVACEVGGLLVFREVLPVQVRPFREHEAAAGGDLERARRVLVPHLVVKESETNPRAAYRLGVLLPGNPASLQATELGPGRALLPVAAVEVHPAGYALDQSHKGTGPVLHALPDEGHVARILCLIFIAKDSGLMNIGGEALGREKHLLGARAR